MAIIHDKNRKWWTLATTTLTLGMVFIDQTIVNVSLPTIQRDFHASDTALQWIVNAYLLTLACFLIIGGRLGDLYGVKKFYLIGLALFTGSSFFCGFAPNERWLIINRGIQGLGGAILFPSLMATFMNTIPAGERGKFLGIQASFAGIFLALGPFIGGLITEVWNWRWIFWINIPVAAIAFTLGSISIKLPKVPKDETLDLLGLVLLTAGLFCIVFALMEGENWGWLSSQTLGLLFGGLIFLGIFKWVESSEKFPLIDFSLFKNNTYFCGVIVISCLQVALISSVFSTIYTQGNLGFSPLKSGILMLPATLPILIITPIAGRVHDKRGPFIPVTLGMLLVGMGMLWMSIFCFYNKYIYFLPGLILLGIGIAVVMSPISAASLSAIPSQKRGVASGIMSAMRQVGGSVGLAVVGALLIFGQRHMFGLFLNQNPLFSKVYTPEDATRILSNTQVFQKHLSQFTEPQIEQLKYAAMYSFNVGFFMAMLFCAISCFIGAWVSWHYLRPGKQIEKLEA